MFLQKVAAQLYTVRDALEKDYNGVLKALKEQGWPAVQVSGTRGYTAPQIAGFLREHGLQPNCMVRATSSCPIWDVTIKTCWATRCSKAT